MNRAGSGTKRSASRRVFLPAVLFLITACNTIQIRQPKTENLIGTYRLDEYTQRFLSEQKGYTTLPDVSIDVRANTIQFVNLPDCAVSLGGYGKGAFVSGTGTWKLRKDFLGYGLDILIDDAGTLGASGLYNRLTLRGGPSQFSLEISLGDPDSGETLLYVRQAG